MSRLSIIIPHFNCPDHLKKLLDSVLKEEGVRDVQIIVVDDNSTKETEAYEALKDAYSGKVEFYINDLGIKGAGAARNVGLARADGEWILFADADDYFVSGWYGAVSDYFEKDYSLIFFFPTSIMETTGELAERHVKTVSRIEDYLNGKKNADLVLRYNHIVPWGKLIRADIIKDNGIRFENVMYSNDVVFSAKLGFYAENMTADRRVIYCCTDIPDSLTKKYDESALSIRFEEHMKENLFLREHLPKNEYDIMKNRLGNYDRIFLAVKRKCGLRYFVRYVGLYFKYRVPFFSLLKHKMILRLKGAVAKRKHS